MEIRDLPPAIQYLANLRKTNKDKNSIADSFIWQLSEERHNFWAKIVNGHYDHFYERYKTLFDSDPGFYIKIDNKEQFKAIWNIISTLSIESPDYNFMENASYIRIGVFQHNRNVGYNINKKSYEEDGLKEVKFDNFIQLKIDNMKTHKIHSKKLLGLIHLIPKNCPSWRKHMEEQYSAEILNYEYVDLKEEDILRGYEETGVQRIKELLERYFPEIINKERDNSIFDKEAIVKIASKKGTNRFNKLLKQGKTEYLQIATDWAKDKEDKYNSLGVSSEVKVILKKGNCGSTIIRLEKK